MTVSLNSECMEDSCYSIIVKTLRKGYGRGLPPAVDLRDGFAVPKGELFGVIGPDGAGKTTLFRLLTTLISPDEGEATVQGLDIIKDYKQLRTIVGYMPGKFSLYPDLSVAENLNFFASVFGTDVKSNYHLIEDIYCRLEPFADRKAGNLSGGMKQKLALCCTLIHSPQVLFLDEPTTGVDPSSRREFWETLARLKKTGMTIVVSTAYMDEANRCDRVAMMKSGRFLKVDSPADIVASFDRTLVAVRSDDMFRLLQDLRSIEAVGRCYTFGDTHHAVLKAGSGASPEDIAQLLEGRYGHTGVAVTLQTATLEDCYMNIDTDADGR